MRQISDKDVSRLASLVVALKDFVDKLESRGVKVSPKQQAKIDSCRANRVCMVCGEALVTERDTRRGTHHQACYNTILNQIRRGEMTEQQAVDAGDWNPITEKPGRKGKHKRMAARAIATAKKIGTKAGTEKP